MPKKTAHKKHSAKRSSSSEKFNFNELLTKKHRPLHFAGLGAIMMFLQGLVAVVGVLLVVGAALTYAMRAYKANR